jgi:orotate phosphoribosyltransferase
VPHDDNQSPDNDMPNQSKLNQLKDNAYNLVSNNPTAVAGVATTGLLSGTALALFLTGILGGKRKRKQQKQQKITVSKKRKTQRRRRNKTIKKRK